PADSPDGARWVARRADAAPRTPHGDAPPEPAPPPPPLVDPRGGNDVVQDGEESGRSEIACGLRRARTGDPILPVDLVVPVMRRRVAALDHLPEEVDLDVSRAIEARGETLGHGGLARGRRAGEHDDHHGQPL